ncbi:MAG: DUF952 domain-containing protein [Pseudomonadota bacterium]
MANVVYKMCARGDWEEACAAGSYTGSSHDARDGFIHLSAADQLAETAAKHFSGTPDLVVIAFDADALGAALRWEPSRGGALFPHLYGPLPTTEALFVADAPLRDGGVPDVTAALTRAQT